jgi:tetratricopeptide (TPR) repeat protein
LSRLILILLALSGAGLAHWGQVRADPLRLNKSDGEHAQFVPSGEALEWISMGFGTQIADWTWLKTVLVFGDLESGVADPLVQEWLEQSLNVSIHLDPEWHTLYSYGGLMLKVVGDIDASNRLLQKAVKRFPDEHYFPFSLAANYFLQSESVSAVEFASGVDLGLTVVLSKVHPLGAALGADVSRAIHSRASLVVATFWMRYAASLEGAPVWYAGAAESFLATRSSHKVAIRFLSEQLEKESDEKLIASLTVQFNTHLHAYHSEALTELVSELGAEVPGSEALQALVDKGLIQQLPADPYGRGWVVDVDSIVRSPRAIERLEKGALASERRMLMGDGS